MAGTIFCCTCWGKQLAGHKPRSAVGVEGGPFMSQGDVVMLWAPDALGMISHLSNTGSY